MKHILTAAFIALALPATAQEKLSIALDWTPIPTTWAFMSHKRRAGLKRSG